MDFEILSAKATLVIQNKDGSLQEFPGTPACLVLPDLTLTERAALFSQGLENGDIAISPTVLETDSGSLAIE
jgi:hypothetical protein